MKKAGWIWVLIWLYTPVLWSTSIEVGPNSAFKRIKQAIEQASAGDTIWINKAVYRENNIIITKPLTIIGRDHPVIDGEYKGQIIQFKTDSFTIDGLLIRNVGQSYTVDYAGVHISKSKKFIIRNMILENVFFGMLIEKSKNGLIENNLVSSQAYDEVKSGNGIHLWHCENIIIRKNELSRLRDGIYFEFVKNSEIYENFSHDNVRYGLHFMFSNSDNYHDNVFVNNGSGVAVMFSKHIQMRRNTFAQNWGMASYGLLLKEIYDAEIINNTFLKNTIGINIEGCTRIHYAHNDFKNNGWALKIAGACYKNVFEKNNFLFNAFDLSYNGQLNNNSFNQNYWSSYTGYDLDKNGTGDVPYRPVKLFSYIVNQTPETIILLRSLFVDIINFSEKVTPVFTPDNLIDKQPAMNPL